MDTHVKVVGWLWIAYGLVGIFIVASGVIIANVYIPNPQDSNLVTSGILCLFLPGIIAEFVAGSWLLMFKSWARILSIVLGIINLIFFPFGTALGIYTLVIMFNSETEALFSGEATSTMMEEVS